jgi:hypothetical protein
MDLGSLLRQVTGLIENQTRQEPGVNTDDLLGQIGGLFRQHANATGQILPASQDPLGDPADQGYQQGYQQSEADRQAGILPASQDPLGDPADQPARR